MTDDQIYELAEAIDDSMELDWRGIDGACAIAHIIDRWIDEARREENEACAKVADVFAQFAKDHPDSRATHELTARDLAHCIRSRLEKNDD